MRDVMAASGVGVMVKFFQIASLVSIGLVIQFLENVYCQVQGTLIAAPSFVKQLTQGMDVGSQG